MTTYIMFDTTPIRRRLLIGICLLAAGKFVFDAFIQFSLPHSNIRNYVLVHGDARISRLGILERYAQDNSDNNSTTMYLLQQKKLKGEANLRAK